LRGRPGACHWAVRCTVVAVDRCGMEPEVGLQPLLDLVDLDEDDTGPVYGNEA
jgi:hypothetical protein